MIQAVSDKDTDRFRTVVARCMGLQFEDAKLGFLAGVLARRAGASGHTPAVYLGLLEIENLPGEVGVLAQELTIPETYFFRYRDQYRAFAETVLPACMAAQAGTRRLRILSAGCASGEETYSLAIVVREAVDSSWDVSILGVDVNPAMVKKAARARYSTWALRETPAPVQQRWFKAEGRDFVLDETLRAAVRFEERNLVGDNVLWPANTYDVIFFRNVFMYFTPGHQRSAIARLERALKPGGYLFVGHAETLRGLSNDFHLQHTHETFYYRRKDQQGAWACPSAEAAPSPQLVPAVVAAVESGGTWIDVIRQASERIETLSVPARSSTRSGDARSPVAMPAWDLALAHELLREERFTEALEMMQGLPAESGRDPDVLLLGAALLTHRGRLDEAEVACQRLLDVDDLSAGAHYLLALCREGARDRKGALHHDQVAIYLDPGFAMPHLHLGLLARREGDRAAAQREFEQALLLLGREDGARVLLFGGGFSRETLVALCRTELVGCGGNA